MKKVLAFSFMMLFLVGGIVLGDNLWLTDFEKAKKIAKESNKPILMDFTGSDWCKWCFKLDGEVFTKKEFQDYAKDNLVLFMADFPKKKKISEELKKQNYDLLKKYGVRGFPTIVILDSEGKELGKTGYQPGGAEAYIKHLKEIIK